MSRTNKRTLDEIADLKREIKERDQTIKSLQREIKALNAELTPKTKKKTKLPTADEIINQVENAHKCPMCPKKMTKAELGIKTLYSCACGFRLLNKRDQS